MESVNLATEIERVRAVNASLMDRVAELIREIERLRATLRRIGDGDFDLTDIPPAQATGQPYALSAQTIARDALGVKA